MIDGPGPELRRALRALRQEHGTLAAAGEASLLDGGPNPALRRQLEPLRIDYISPRQRVLDAVAACEGRPARQAHLASGLHHRDFRRVLRQLQDSKQVVAVRHGPVHLLFLNRPGIEEHGAQLGVLANQPEVGFLYRHLTQAQGVARQDLLRRATTEWGWPTRSTEDRIQVLVNVGLVAARTPLARDRRLTFLQAMALPEDLVLLLGPGGFFNSGTSQPSVPEEAETPQAPAA